MSPSSSDTKTDENGGIATGLVDEQALALDHDPDVRGFCDLLAKIIARLVAKNAERSYNAEKSLECGVGVRESEG